MPTPLTNHELEAAAKILRALAHPVRLGVLQALGGGERTVSELACQLQCSPSMMSQQLTKMEYQHLIETRKVGTTKYCGLRNPELLNLFRCLNKHMCQYLSIREDAPPEERNQPRTEP